MDPRLERLVLVVVPGLPGDVPVIDEDRLRVPVLDLSGQPVAALQDEDSLAGRREVSGKRPAARAAADDDDVVGMILAHRAPPAVVTASTASSCSQTIRGVPLRSSASGARS